MEKGSFRSHFIKVLCLCCLLTPGVSAQTERANKQEAYQNQQRAANLAVMRPTVKLLDDAPQRCVLRIQIIRFIFEKKVTNYFDTANSLALECLDETVDNKEQFSESQSNRQKSEILLLLRKYSPETAVKVEKRYFSDGPATDLTDELETLQGKDPNAVANRLISKIARDGITPSLVPIIPEIRKVNNAAAIRLLSAVLDHYESHLEEAYSGNDLIFLSEDYRDSRTPVELKKRFYNLMVRLGEAAIAQPENEELTQLYLEIIKYSLADLKEASPELYPRAFSIYNALNSKKSAEEKEREEVMERINASKDKLVQTISEAESAESLDLKDSLWLYASTYAMEAKKFRIAAESRLKMRAAVEPVKKAQYFFIKDEVLDGCLKENDIESARYVIGLVEDLEMKSEGLFKIAAKLVELKKRDAAVDVLSDGWKILEKVDSTTSKLWVMHLAIPIALKIDKNRAFDMAGDIIKAVNRFPTPGPDDKPGTEARQKFAETLTGVSYNLESTFRQLGKENLPLADAISQGIQLKEWRLAVQIGLETQRTYPLPPEPAEKPKQAAK
jgi:hypothetical protein